MSLIAHGLKCTNPNCDLVEGHVYYRKSAGPPECPECGQPRRIDWSHGEAPAGRGDGYGSFTPLHMGAFGRVETKEAYDRVMATVQQRWPGQQLVVEHDSQEDKHLRADEARQRSHDQKKKHGLDATIDSEIKEMRKAKMSEAKHRATKNNKDSSKTKLTGKDTTSAAKLVGSAHTS